jgi:ABC-type bacteriocin/lantibiotic exporter with double-glycine peptidase domain
VLTEYLRDARATIIVVVLATLLGALAATAAPYLFSRAIDELASGVDRTGALQILLLYALLFGCAKAFGQGARFLIFLCAERLSFIANTTFFVRLLHKTPSFFLEHNAAEIGTARQQGTQTLNIVTQLGLGGILPGCVQILVSLALLGNLVSWDIALIVLAYGIAVVALDYIRVGRVKPASASSTPTRAC